MQFLKNSCSESFNNFRPFSELKQGRNNFNWGSISEENNFNSKAGLTLVARMPVVMSAS